MHTHAYQGRQVRGTRGGQSEGQGAEQTERRHGARDGVCSNRAWANSTVTHATVGRGIGQACSTPIHRTGNFTASVCVDSTSKTLAPDGKSLCCV